MSDTLTPFSGYPMLSVYSDPMFLLGGGNSIVLQNHRPSVLGRGRGREGGQLKACSILCDEKQQVGFNHWGREYK